MKEEQVIYTDGHGVKITDTKFYADKKEYNLDGITHIDLQRIPASSVPGIVLFILGFFSILAGSLDLFANMTYAAGETTYIINSNTLAIVLGVLLIIGAIIWMILAKDKYAVEIRTAEGEKKPIVSKSREYVAIVVDSLRQAYYRFTDTELGQERGKKRNNVKVS